MRLLRFRAQAGGETVGIAPLCIGSHWGTPLRRLTWIGAGVSDCLGPIALPEHSLEVAHALLRFLRSERSGWDIADLPQLRPEEPLATLIASEAFQSVAGEPCPYVKLPDTWEAMTARIGKNLRSHLGYAERLVTRTFPDAEFRLATAETLETDLTTLFTLHRQRWNARCLPGALSGRRVQAFHREVAAQFLANGWLRLHLLSADGEVRAGLYAFAFGGRTFYYQSGFAPEFARYSPGTLLIARAIRQAITEGHTEFDFLRGAEAYKYRWLPGERISRHLLLPRSRRGNATLPGHAGAALCRLERHLEERAKSLAAHLTSTASRT